MQPLDSESVEAGHIARNTRLGLMAVDVAMPYVCLSSLSLSTSTSSVAIPIAQTRPKVGSNASSNTINTSNNSSSSSHGRGQRARRVTATLPSSDSNTGVTEIAVNWFVGGAMTVDATWLSFHAPPSSPSPLSSSSYLQNDNDNGNYGGLGGWSKLLEALKPPPFIPYPPSSYPSSSNHSAHMIRHEKLRIEKSKRRGLGSAIDKGKVEGSGPISVKTPTATATVDTNRGRKAKEEEVSSFQSMSASYAQKGEARWGKLNMENNYRQPQMYSSTVRVQGAVNASINIFSSSSSSSNSTSINQPIVTLTPGVYWLVVWTVVDSAWGVKGQGHGSAAPESYLTNTRTNTELAYEMAPTVAVPNLSFRSKRNAKENTIESNERKEYVSAGKREVKGRRFWPSDPIVVEVLKGGEVKIISSVLQCAWWNRVATATSTVNSIGVTSDPKNKDKGQNGSDSTGRDHVNDKTNSISVKENDNRDDESSFFLLKLFSENREAFSVALVLVICGVFFALWKTFRQSRRRRQDGALYTRLPQSGGLV